MIPFHNAMSIAGGSEAVKTYAEFQAYIAAQATGGLLGWGASIGSSVGAFRFMTQTGAPSYAPMVGSSWGPLTPDGISGSYSYWFGAILHAMPSASVANAIRAASGEVLLRVEDGGIASPAYGSYTRNGFTSSASSAASTYVRHITEMLAFVPGEGPIKMQPKLGLGPVPFSW